MSTKKESVKKMMHRMSLTTFNYVIIYVLLS